MTTEIQAASLPVSKLRIFLVILALIKTLGAISGLGGALAAYYYYGGSGGFAQWLLFAGAAALPFLAIAALVLAAKGDLPRAIMAIAIMIIIGFVADGLPGLLLHGLDSSASPIATLFYLALAVLFPLLAVIALVWAHRNEKLVLAAVLVSLPSLGNLVAMIAFAIGISKHGF
jgi:hypothetical protein